MWGCEGLVAFKASNWLKYNHTNRILEFIFVLNVVYVWLQGSCTGWIINLGFLIAHRVWVSDILFLVFHEKVI